MLRLTLRSGRDGRFLARVIDRNIGAFVLDYGDPSVVSEASELALRGGFRTWRGGAWETAAPQDPHMIVLLAHHFAAKGHLVFLDEPSFAGRTETVEERLPHWLDNERTDGTDFTDDTELVPTGEVPSWAQLGPVPLATEDLLPDLDEDDVPTEHVTRGDDEDSLDFDPSSDHLRR